MKEYKFITLRENPELIDKAATWFNSKWKVPKEESSDECIKMKAFLEEKGARIEAFEL